MSLARLIVDGRDEIAASCQASRFMQGEATAGVNGASGDAQSTVGSRVEAR